MGHTKLNCDKASTGVIADDEPSHNYMHSGCTRQRQDSFKFPLH